MKKPVEKEKITMKKVDSKKEFQESPMPKPQPANLNI